MIALDIEVLPNYFLLVMKSIETGNVKQFEMIGTGTSMSRDDRRKIKYLLTKHSSFGFNSNKYDMPLINYMLDGVTCNAIYKASCNIIENRLPDFITYKTYEITNNKFDHIDLIEPSPAVMVSLKNYGARMGSKKLKEFYLDPHTEIEDYQLDEFRAYCINDVDTTIDLYNHIKERIQLREDMMNNMYSGIRDLRSLSDAQVAEAIFLFKLGISKPKPAKVPKTITYSAPDFIEFKSDELNMLLHVMCNIEIPVNQANGQPKLPKEWTTLLKPKIGDTVYKIGLGGIHSQEKKLVVESDDEYVLRNADIASMYPSIILLMGLYPLSCGKKFLDVYNDIYTTRLEAKKRAVEIKKEMKTKIKEKIKELEIELEGCKLTSDSLKISINGSYGKLGSKYSFLYAPELMLSVTLTGQLMMLMLIEELNDKGFNVVSSNTDGIELKVLRSRLEEYEAIIFDWELTTGMNMEHGEYKALYARDVNNYVAKYDGYVKAKGVYAETSLVKGRNTPIVYTAIREYINSSKQIEATIRECKDINEFIAARNVKGGGCYKGNPIGKTVRWYYSIKGSTINYCTNGNLVPKTSDGNGVVPLMDLPEDIPSDLDYEWYINEAIDKLKDLGLSYE